MVSRIHYQHHHLENKHRNTDSLLSKYLHLVDYVRSTCFNGTIHYYTLKQNKEKAHHLNHEQLLFIYSIKK